MTQTQPQLFAKIAVVGAKGGQGKTTVFDYIFKAFLSGEHISVESVNASGKENMMFRAEDFKRIMSLVSAAPIATIDLGASNAETFFEELFKAKNSHNAFDIYVIPATPNAAGAVLTITMLAKLGVPPERILVLRNRVNVRMGEYYGFDDLMVDGRATVLKSYLSENSVYGEIDADSLDFSAVLADTTDYSLLMRRAPTPEGRTAATAANNLRGQARTARAELQAVFAEVMKYIH